MEKYICKYCGESFENALEMTLHIQKQHNDIDDDTISKFGIVSEIDLETIPTDAGIYCFKNIVNNKCYIGQAQDIRSRFKTHVAIAMREKVRESMIIYSAFKKYGFDSFEFYILKINNDISKLDELEINAIKGYDSITPNGYNQTSGGCGVRGRHMTNDDKKKISAAAIKTSKDGRYKVYCYIISEKRIVEASNLIELNKVTNVRFTTSDISNIRVHTNYCIARSMEDLNVKIIYILAKDAKINGGKFTYNMIKEILNGMSEKDFIKKYNVCRKTYSNYKNVDKNYKREYKVNYDRHELYELYSYIMSGVKPKIIYEKMGITYKQYKLGKNIYLIISTNLKPHQNKYQKRFS